MLNNREASKQDAAESLTWSFEDDAYYDNATGIELVSDAEDERPEDR